MSKFNAPPDLTSASRLISLRDCRVERDGHTLLDNVSWDVQAGQQWAILGGNGSGKTTLLNLVSGYVWPTAGTATVLGQRFGHVDLRELRQRMGFVSTAIADRFRALRPTETVNQVVLSGAFASIGLYGMDPTAAGPRLEAAATHLERMGIAHLATRSWATLSTGEQQRALVARALMADPELLLLDEPCAGLDLKGREELLHYLEAGLSGPGRSSVTALYVTHYPEEILPCFTHVLLLKGGQSLAQGPKYTVLTPTRLSTALDVPLDVSWSLDRPWVRAVGVPHHAGPSGDS